MTKIHTTSVLVSYPKQVELPKTGTCYYCEYQADFFFSDTESWHLLSPQGAKGKGSGPIPPARHKHSAVMHGDSMWVFGGMTDLQARSDLWRWDVSKRTWTSVRPRGAVGPGAGKGPGALHSHAAAKLPGAMVIFGGEKDGNPASDVWSFHFGRLIPPRVPRSLRSSIDNSRMGRF